MPWWLLAPASVVLLLVAAKAHGRQVRLEREQKGVFEVDFRRPNPAVVEAIWKRDRWTFWPTAACAAAAGGFFVLFAALRPADLAWGGAAVFAWSLSLAFIVAGVSSWVRMTLRDEGPLPWRRRAMMGSVGWWLGVALALAGVWFAYWA